MPRSEFESLHPLALFEPDRLEAPRSRAFRHAAAESEFEAHHRDPLSTSDGIRHSRLADFAILCASCHRLIHAVMRLEARTVTVEEYPARLNRANPGHPPTSPFSTHCRHRSCHLVRCQRPGPAVGVRTCQRRVDASSMTMPWAPTTASAVACDGPCSAAKAKEHRRGWIEDRIADLQAAMAIDATAWCVMSNHMHLVVTTRPDLVRTWSDREVAERYLRMCPGGWKRRRRGIPVDGPPTEAEIAAITETPGRLEVIRRRLSSLSWFMAKLKEFVARRANLEDGCRGHFWEQRFRSVRVLDRTGLLATATYVDLNAVRAGMVDRPEDTPNGSIAERVRMLLGLRRRTRIRLEPAPFEDEAGYLSHVDAWGRALTQGKHAIPPELPPLLERLGLGRQGWLGVLRRGWDELRGTVLGTPESRRAEAKRRGGRWVIDPTARHSIAD